MSWLITPTQLLVDDQDALTYLAAVEAADGQALESGVRLAVNAFVKGCKADGIWPAIKSSCILSGARTLAGALVPLVGTAPASNTLSAGSYSRKIGPLWDGTNNLDTGVLATTLSPVNLHCGVYATVHEAKDGVFRDLFGAGLPIVWNKGGDGSDATVIAAASSLFSFGSNLRYTGWHGVSKALSGQVTWRENGLTTTTSVADTALSGVNIFIGSRSAAVGLFKGRLAFYSIGESLNLALLDTRVTTLINALSAAIP